MTLLEIINNVLYEETLPVDRETGKRKTGIILLDVDDTLLQARDIYIWRKRPEDKSEVRLTPQEYADEKVAPGEKKYYSYREFRDAEKVKNSIIKGLPYINNLKIMDEFINGGYVIGILTARGMEDVVYQALSEFLKYRGPDGNLRPVKLNRKLVFAVNDDFKVYIGRTDYEKKKNVIRKIKDHFDYVYFLDDDIKNIKEVKSLKKELSPEDARKIRTIKAEPPKKKLNESYLIEMAVQDLRDQRLKELLFGKFEKIKDKDGNETGEEKMVEEPDLVKAGHHYIDLVLKSTPKVKGVNRYSGKSWMEIAHSISGQGLSRSINTAMKQGVIDQGFADKIRKAVDLGVKNPPDGVLERDRKEKEESQRSKEEHDIAKKEKEEEKVTGGEDPEKDTFVIRVRKEIKRAEKINDLFLREFLDADLSSVSSNVVKEYEKDLEWVKNSFIPSFVKEPEINEQRSKELASKGEEIAAKEDTIKTIWRLESYKKTLKEVDDTIEYINKYSGLKTKEEKIEELKSNVGFDVLFKKLNRYLSSITPKEADKEVKFSKESLVDRAKSRDLAPIDTKSMIDTYFKKLNDVEKAYNSGNLRSFIARNIKDLRSDISSSSYAVRAKSTDKYKKPEGFDNKEITESEKIDDAYGGIYKNRRLGKKTRALANERLGKDYSYSGIERDASELKYLENYAKTGEGSEEKVFRIFASMYLDFIDGVGIVVGSKNKGEENKGEERAKIIEKNKRLKKREEELRNIKIEHYGPREVKDLIFIRVHKMKNELKKQIKPLLAGVDFDSLSDEELRKYIFLAKNFALGDEGFYKELINMSNVTSSLTIDQAKGILDKEIAKFTPEEKFKHRVAISVNYKGGKFSDEQVKELATAAINDPSGKELLDKLSTKEYSTRIQN